MAQSELKNYFSQFVLDTEAGEAVQIKVSCVFDDETPRFTMDFLGGANGKDIQKALDAMEKNMLYRMNFSIKQNAEIIVNVNGIKVQ